MTDSSGPHHPMPGRQGPDAVPDDPPERVRPLGGIRVGSPFHVPVYVAPSWFLIAALITWLFGSQLGRIFPELGGWRYPLALFFAVAFYGSVLVHELAHTVVALRFGLPVRRIQLQFFGGVSEIEEEAPTAGREFAVAVAGPALSVVLTAVCWGLLTLVRDGTVPAALLGGLMVSNLIVAVFNLLPGLPLDGGRVLRALVWRMTGSPMAGTVAAAWIGRLLAIAVLIGLPLLSRSGNFDHGTADTLTDALLGAVLAAIIWTGAGSSVRQARLKERLPGLRVSRMLRHAVEVTADTPLAEALRRAHETGARGMIVVDGAGAPVGVVRESAVIEIPEHRRPWVAVGALAERLRPGMRLSSELAGEDLLRAMRNAPASEYLVIEPTGQVLGVLSALDVQQAFVAAAGSA